MFAEPYPKTVEQKELDEDRRQQNVEGDGEAAPEGATTPDAPASENEAPLVPEQEGWPPPGIDEVWAFPEISTQSGNPHEAADFENAVLDPALEAEREPDEQQFGNGS